MVFSGVVNCLRPWTWWVDILVRLHWICWCFTANFPKMFFCCLISTILWRCGRLVFTSCSQVWSSRTGFALLQKRWTSWWCSRRGGVYGQVRTPPSPPPQKKTFVTTHNTLINGYLLFPREHSRAHISSQTCQIRLHKVYQRYFCVRWLNAMEISRS